MSDVHLPPPGTTIQESIDVQNLSDADMESLAGELAILTGQATSVSDVTEGMKSSIKSQLKEAQKEGKPYTFTVTIPMGSPRLAPPVASLTPPPLFKNPYIGAACFMATLYAILSKLQKLNSQAEFMDDKVKAQVMGGIAASAKLTAYSIQQSAQQQHDMYQAAGISAAVSAGVCLGQASATFITAARGSAEKAAREENPDEFDKLDNLQQQKINKNMELNATQKDVDEDPNDPPKIKLGIKAARLKEQEETGTSIPPSPEEEQLENDINDLDDQISDKQETTQKMIERKSRNIETYISKGGDAIQKAAEAAKSFIEANATITKGYYDALTERARAATQLLEGTMGSIGDTAKKFGEQASALAQQEEKLAEYAKNVAKMSGQA